MDATSLLRSVGSLGAVLGMLLIALWATRRYNLRLPGAPQPNGARRLVVVERVALDARRSVALIRRDGCEHLVLTSPEGHQLLETGIAAPAPAVPEDFATVLAATTASSNRATPSRDLAAIVRTLVEMAKPGIATLRASIKGALSRLEASRSPSSPAARGSRRTIRPASAKSAKRRSGKARSKPVRARA